MKHSWTDSFNVSFSLEWGMCVEGRGVKSVNAIGAGAGHWDMNGERSWWQPCNVQWDYFNCPLVAFGPVVSSLGITLKEILKQSTSSGIPLKLRDV